MRFLFDIGHPAHVHYFRIVANKLQKEGHSVLFTLRNKDIAEDLLIKYNFEYVKLGKSRKGLINKILWVIKFTVRIIKVIRNLNQTYSLVFYSPYLDYALTICRIPSLVCRHELAIFNIKYISIFLFKFKT
jgi:predicted glycosyltransferase